MNVFLLYPDRDADKNADPPPQADALIRDLGLAPLFRAMADGDDFVHDACRRVLIGDGVPATGMVLYRQAILNDCLTYPNTVDGLYRFTLDALEVEKQAHLWGIGKSPAMRAKSSRDMLLDFTGLLRRLCAFCREHAVECRGAGLRRLFSMVETELGDDYPDRAAALLERVDPHRELLVGARLGESHRSTALRILRRPGRGGWLRRLFQHSPKGLHYRLPERDEAGSSALRDWRDRALTDIADALSASCRHLIDLFAQLRFELAFYRGAMTLHRKLVGLGAPLCFPTPVTPQRRHHQGRGLYDPCLALGTRSVPVGNDLNLGDAARIVITGANRGGKSTLLRALGIAQLMMQAGLFVAASDFSANLCRGLFSHYKREEDSAMESGKFDEELARMSDIVDRLRPGSMLLSNESFSVTNQREGGEIAGQILKALAEANTKVFFVTHLYDFAHDLYQEHPPDARFLRAERRDDGERTFRIVEAEPLPTSYGKDLYRNLMST